ncbi:MAG: 50S ribosomal protein L19 [Phycisphaerae bacterium]
MSQELIDLVEQPCLKERTPAFAIGNTVDVRCRIVEGEKERIQVFNGVVIARRGRGINETFTVRRIVGKEGVERIFPLHSPNVVSVKVVRRGKVRRAKLYYLRSRVGKARRLREVRVQKKSSSSSSPALVGVRA